MTEPDVQSVLRQFRLTPSPGQIESLGGAGGFSGAQFWRVRDADGIWCLRRWPVEHPTPDGLARIHAILRHVFEHGFKLVPIPSPAESGATFVSQDGHLWELAPWLPGQADFRLSPSPAKLQAAMRALAEFHRAASDTPGEEPRIGVSPGLEQRHRLLNRWTSGQLRDLAQAIQPKLWPELAQLGRRLLAAFPRGAARLATPLSQTAQTTACLQPCIRDIWHAHVLFQGDRLSGLVDFGSMQTDHVGGDIARLLGSLVGDAADGWKLGLESYRAVSPLSEADVALVRAFDMANVVLSGMNWLEWVFVEGRTFDDRPAVVERVAEILARLECLASR